jgi:hypothetical protein
MFLSIFNGIVLGIGLRLLIILLGFLCTYLGLDKTITKILFNGKSLTFFGDYLGLWIILISTVIAIIANISARKQLIKTYERKFSPRIGVLIFSCLLFHILENNVPNSNEYGFLWALSLLKPDTIAVVAGWPINLLAILSLSTYIAYTLVLCMRRKSVNEPLHIACALTFFFLIYNTASGFFLFWLIQSLSLLILARGLVKINKPTV